MHPLANTLESLYLRLHHRRFVHPDPLEFVYLYPGPRDREVVALVASSLASGRVAGVLRSVAKVLAAIGPSPAETIAAMDEPALARRLKGFVHRFVNAQHMAALLAGAGRLLHRHGSLEAVMAENMQRYRGPMAPAQAMATALRQACGGRCGWLVPRPEATSPMKRLWLMMRWLVRSDNVDPGGWEVLEPSRLVVPLDTHMLRLGRLMGLIGAKTASAKAAVELTRAFGAICPEDPLRYDFVLTRLGIRGVSAPELLAPAA